MIIKSIVAIALFSTSVLAAETVTKNSLPFSFPTTVGVSWNKSTQGDNIGFTSQFRSNGKKSIDLSWSIPAKAISGSIAIYNVAGARIKTFPITKQAGLVRWDLASEKAAKGIYFAKLMYGSYKKNLKLFVY